MPLEPLFALMKPKSLPSVFDVGALPPLRDRDGAPVDGGAALLRALAAKDGGRAARAAAREHLDRDATDAWLAALFEQWVAAGGHGRFGYVLEALGELGGDRCALALEPYLERWPKASDTERKRAIRAIGALREIGTDTALLVLLGVGQRDVLPTIAEASAWALEQAAGDRGVSVGELGDRITPGCGLAADGTKRFDYGRRIFDVIFDEYFEPRVRDVDGHVGAALPEPEPGDDPEAAARARDEWAVLAGQLSGIARIQAARLEEAMITERRWGPAAWRRHLHGHPLMIHFTRRLVWGVFDPKTDALQRSFRTSEDDTLVDLDDEEIALPTRGRIGIVHPLHLSEAQRLAWSEHVADYEVVPPFAQMGRPLYPPTEIEREANALVRWEGVEIPATAVHDGFIELGFRRDDNYLRRYYEKAYMDGAVRARVRLDPGMYAGDSDRAGPQTIPKVDFRRKGPALKIANVSDVAVSEVVLAIERVRAMDVDAGLL